IIAEFDFPIYKSEVELARERAEAAASVSPIFDFEASAVDTMMARIATFMAQADSAARSGDDAAAAIRDLMRGYGFAVTAEAVELLGNDTQRNNLRRSLELAVGAELPVGVAQAAELEESLAPQVRIRTDDGQRLVPRDSIVTATAF